jgi:crossover junction endodeoxyribonuclease RuvC
MIFIGVDVGMSGAIAGVDHTGEFVFAEEMPVFAEGKTTAVDAVAVSQLLSDKGPLLAAVEKVGAMPNQGVVSMFNFGKSYGTVLGVLGAMQIPITDVTPQLWKKHYGLIGKDKDAGRGVAIKLFPKASLARKKDHGKADALLIARWLLESHTRWMR